MSVLLTNNFLANARGITFADGGGITWSFNKNTNTLTATGSGGGVLSSVGLADDSATPIYTVGNSPLTANGTLTLTLKTQAVGAVLAGPATGSAAQPAFRALVASDIPQLAYSSLSGLPTIPTGANPSASVGLTAVNGAASTFMRSDAAPALDQTITPTWAGKHTFSATVAITAPGSAVSALTVNAYAAGGIYAATFVCSATSARGLLIYGGANATSDFPLVIANSNNTVNLFTVDGAGNVNFGGAATTTTAPGAGGAGALPATPAGYMTIQVGGTARKVPYY